MKIEISEHLFERLQKLAQPLVDTPETVIDRALSAFELASSDTGRSSKLPGSLGSSGSASAEVYHNLGELPGSLGSSGSASAEVYHNLGELPSLLHTRIISASFGHQRVIGKWVNLHEKAHVISAKLLGNHDELINITKSNIVTGKGNREKGFQYIPELGCSLQRCDANTTLRNVVHLAKELDLPVRIEFEWADNPKAVFPGKRAQIKIDPVSEGLS